MVFSGSTPPRTYEIPCDNYRRGFKLTPVAIKRRFFGVHCATYKRRRATFLVLIINRRGKFSRLIVD